MARTSSRTVTVRIPAKAFALLADVAEEENVTLESFVEARIGDMVGWVRREREPGEESPEEVQPSGMYL